MENFTLTMCPICNPEKNKGAAILIPKTAHKHLTQAGYTQESIDLLYCIKKFDATICEKFDLPGHIENLFNQIKNLTLNTDFHKYWKKSPKIRNPTIR